MGPKYSQQVTVHIWRNLKTLGCLPTSHFGHASVSLRGSLIKTSNQIEHLSFWPGDEGGAGIGKSGLKKQKGSTTTSLEDDEENEMNKLTALRLEVGFRQMRKIPYPNEWDQILAAVKKKPLDKPKDGQHRMTDGLKPPLAPSILDVRTKNFEGLDLPVYSQSPEESIALPGLGEKTVYWALNTRRISIWWDDFKKKEPFYRALSSQNCAGVAFWALQAGASEAFAPLPLIHIYAEPRQVLEYALRVEDMLKRMDEITVSLENDLNESLRTGLFKSSEPSKTTVNNLWTREEWKRASHLGGLTIRSGTIREIDDAVETYHQSFKTDHFPTRFKALADIIRGIYKHRLDKPESKRLEALLRLAAQVIAILAAARKMK